MKALFVMIALTLPSLSSAAEYLDVDCYIAEGTTVTKTFDGYIFGSVKTVGNRVVVEGRTLEIDYIRKSDTPATCSSSRVLDYDNDGNSYYRDIDNVKVFAFDFSQVELSCALGSVVKRYGNLDNFKKAQEQANIRSTSSGSKPLCLDLTNLE